MLKNKNKFIVCLDNSTIIVDDFIDIEDDKIKIKIKFKSAINIITCGSCNPEFIQIDKIKIFVNTHNIKKLLKIINKINNDENIFDDKTDDETGRDAYIKAIEESINEINEQKFKYKKNVYNNLI